MNEQKPRIGVVIANYNNSKYIRDCFDSVIRQTTPPDIIIVVDDCSTDDSWEVIQNLGKLTSITTRVIQTKENKGVSHARNVGITELLSMVDVFLIADSDDIMRPEKIQKSVEIMQKYPNISVVYSDYTMMYESGKTPQREYKYPFVIEHLSKECIVSCNSVVSKKALQTAGLYDESFKVCEDYDLWIRLANISVLYHIPEDLFIYRIRANSLTSNPQDPMWQEHWQKLYNKHFAPRKEDNNGRRS